MNNIITTQAIDIYKNPKTKQNNNNNKKQTQNNKAKI